MEVHVNWEENGEEVTGNLISIYAARSSIMNYPGKSRHNDEVWFVHKSKNHLSQVPVTITIKAPK